MSAITILILGSCIQVKLLHKPPNEGDKTYVWVFNLWNTQATHKAKIYICPVSTKVLRWMKQWCQCYVSLMFRAVIVLFEIMWQPNNNRTVPSLLVIDLEVYEYDYLCHVTFSMYTNTAMSLQKKLILKLWFLARYLLDTLMSTLHQQQGKLRNII